jgi:hypothetical protein
MLTPTHGYIRLRCVTRPDPAQAALLDRLGNVLPKRMRLTEHIYPRFKPPLERTIRTKTVVPTFRLSH